MLWPTKAPRLSVSTYPRMETVSCLVSTPYPYASTSYTLTMATKVMDHCLRSSNYVNVIVSDKQEHLQYLSMEGAIEHCTKGIGIWPQFSTDAGQEPDLVMASCGDISTHESLAAIDLLLQHFPDLKIRCVNCVDLFKLIHPSDHSHGLTDAEWVSLFTADKPIIFNFHSYPWLVHRLTYKRPGNQNLHVRGMYYHHEHIRCRQDEFFLTYVLQDTRRRVISTPHWSWLFATRPIVSVLPWMPSTVCQTCITRALPLARHSSMHK
jgi:hypothetical protein